MPLQNTATCTAEIAIDNMCLFHSADLGIPTDTTFSFSSICVVLALVAGRLDCQPGPNSQQQTLQWCFSSY